MANLILTIAIGDRYKKLAELTNSTMKFYAQKIGADFKCITEKKISITYLYYEKFIIKEYLDTYDKVLFLDNDVIIRKDCPNLFDIVPEKEMGLYNEGLLTTDKEKLGHIKVMQNTFKEYKQNSIFWDGKFYNTGVMVIPQNMKYLFNKPNYEMFDNYWDQGYLNMKFLIENCMSQIFDIGYKFNRMYYVDSKVKEHRQKSYIIHYAGIQNITPYVLQDLEEWNKL